MPKNSARLATRRQIWSESKPRCAMAPIIPWVSRADCAGDARSVAALVQDRLAQSGFVVEAQRRHHRAVGIKRTDQPLAFQRRPDRRITQPTRIACSDYRAAEMKMIAVRFRRPDQNSARLVTRQRILAKARELLQKGKGLQLQRIETERIFLRRHPF